MSSAETRRFNATRRGPGWFVQRPSGDPVYWGPRAAAVRLALLLNECFPPR